MSLLLQGVEKHLHSPIQNVRTLGMVVGENLMNDLNLFNTKDETEKEEKKLKFDVFKKHININHIYVLVLILISF